MWLPFYLIYTALQKARMQYLEQATGPMAYPYYWGSFVLIGDSDPVRTRSFAIMDLIRKWWAWLILTGIVGAVWMIRTRVKSS
jgi:hypothetical protein